MFKEDVYLKGYADGRDAARGVAGWIAFYNAERPHASLGYKPPAPEVFMPGFRPARATAQPQPASSPALAHQSQLN